MVITPCMIYRHSVERLDAKCARMYFLWCVEKVGQSRGFSGFSLHGTKQGEYW
jgi:hypothetical protein